MRSFQWLALTALVVMAATPIPAQIFNQDERVNINVDGEDGKALTVFRTDEFTDLNDYVSKIYELQTEGLEITPFIRALVETEGGNVRSWNYFDENGETHSFMQVVSTPYQIPFVDELVATYDRPGMISHVGGIRRHFRVRNRLASDLAAILNNGIVTGEGAVIADDTTNTLFIRDSKSDGNRDLNVAMYYDVPPRMVDFNLEIVEMDVSNTAQLGLDWEAWKSAASGFIQFSAGHGDNVGPDFHSVDMLLNINATALVNFVNYMVNNGNGNVITRTTLTAINGEVASFSSAQQVAVGLQEENTIQEGVRLDIAPTIGTDSMTALVECEVNSIIGENNVDQPLLSTRRIETVINIENNETVLLGAFDKTSQIEVENGIVGLRHIPILGPWIFSETSMADRQSKVFVFVTPQIDDHVIYDNIQLDYGKRVEGPADYPYATGGGYMIPEEAVASRE